MKAVQEENIGAYLTTYAHVEDVSQALFEVAQWPDKFIPDFSRHGGARERVLNNARLHWNYVSLWGSIVFHSWQPNTELPKQMMLEVGIPSLPPGIELESDRELPKLFAQQILTRGRIVCNMELEMLALAIQVAPHVRPRISGPAYWLAVMRVGAQFNARIALGDIPKARLSGRSQACKVEMDFLSKLNSHVIDCDEAAILRMADNILHPSQTLYLTAATVACENEKFYKNSFKPFLRNYRKGLRALQTKGLPFAYIDPVRGYITIRQGRRKK